MLRLTQDTIENLVKGIYVPVNPSVLAAVYQEQEKTSPNPTVIAELIACDVGLSACILKAVNSPLLGLDFNLSDIKQAVLLLGVENVADLVGYYELQPIAAENISIRLERFWESSVEIAQMLLLWWHKLEMRTQCPEGDAYALGLFHDCGIAVMARQFANYREVLLEANASDEGFTVVEERYFSTNHAVVGFCEASAWHFPKNLCDMILRHHDRHFFTDPSVDNLQKNLMGLLHLAINGQHQYSRLSNYSEWELFKPLLLQHFDLSEHEYTELEEDIISEFSSTER